MKSPIIPVAALLGLLAMPAYAQAILSDLGTTAPTTFDTGYTGSFDNRYSFDGPISPATTPVDSHGQSFLPATTGNLEYLYMAYNAGGLGSFKVHVDTNYAGGGGTEILADSATAGTVFTINIASFISGGLSGSSANGNGSPVYWMKIDLSNQGVALTAGQTAAFFIVAVSESASDSSFIFAPHYKGTSNPYAGGAVIPGSGFATPPAGSDFGFAVSVRSASDTDGDGLNDAWELSFAGITSLTDLNGTLTGPGPGSASGDFDGDGLSDLAEFTAGTNPTLADTDGDTISDKNEIDAKNAGGVSHSYGATSPLLPDSDADGIRDDYELTGKNAAGVVHAFGPTNPNSADSDGDGMGDLYELTNNLNGGLNPNTNDASGNLDGDTAGWTNLAEYLGTNTGNVQTRADKLDTDGDGLEDIVENKSGTWTDATATGTNPTILDTDNDGLNDNLENPDLTFPGAGVTPTNSNPNIADTDTDGLNDKIEVNLGTNPTETDTDGDTYADKVEVLNGSNPALASSVPASTAVSAGTDFAGSLSWLNTGGGVTADPSSPLLPGSGSNGLLNNNTNNTGAMVSFANPAAVAYYSIDVRYTGTLDGSGFNVVSSNNLTVQTGNFNHCALRFIPGGTFGYSNGGTFNTTTAPVTPHQADHTYTVQFVHDIPNNTYTIRVYDRSASDAVIFEITPAVPTRNTTPGTTLYFGAGIQQDSTTGFQLRMDNLFVSSAPITIPSSNNFAGWANANGATGQAADQDHDNDGVDNGIEYFMGQTGSSFTSLPVPDSNGKVSWTKNPNFLGTFAVQTSPDLSAWSIVTHTVNGNQIEYTLPTGQGKVFVRLSVVPN